MRDNNGAQLTVENGWSCEMHGLGKIRPIKELSKKRITVATREVLRDRYGLNHIHVSCDDVEYINDGWIGSCEIDGQPFKYRISRL